MTKSKIFTLAHQIASYRDSEKVGNKIFRFISNFKYATKFAKALKYVYKSLKKKEAAVRITSKTPTRKQFDFLNRIRTIRVEINYPEFAEKYTRKEISRMIDLAINDDYYYTIN